jgi:GGDEF domain-containing protein
LALNAALALASGAGNKTGQIVSASSLAAALSAFAVTAGALLWTLRPHANRGADTTAHGNDALNQAPISQAAHHEAAEAALYRRITTDPLTCVANRRHFLARLDETIAQTQREPDRHIAAITFTLSNPIFDALSLGASHDPMHYGDGASLEDPLSTLSIEQKNSLKRLAQRCRTSLRPGDLICRLDGVCFAVLLPNAKPRAAMACAERLRQAMDLLPLTDDGETPIPYSVTFGVATHKTGETGQDLIDRCLQTQSMARNRHDSVLFASNAPPLGAIDDIRRQHAS